MNKCLIGIVIGALSVFLFVTNTFAEGEHDHDHGATEEHSDDEHDTGEHSEEHAEEHNEDVHHKDHGKEGEHGHAENDEHEEEGGAKVGVDKGITEKGAQGFKLSKEAAVAFGLKFENYVDHESEFSKSAVVYIKNGQYVYRLRDDWIKRVPIKAVKLSNTKVKVLGSDLKDSDQIFTSGTGFIRGAELILSEGATHSH